MLTDSCSPGQTKVPAYPQPIHNGDPESTNLLPHVGSGEACDEIPADAMDHDTRVEYEDFEKVPYPRAEQIRTIKESGGRGGCKHHYQGKRRLTVREIFHLQGFPLNHLLPKRMSDTDKVRQSGNAVPPSFMKQVFESVVQMLRSSNRDQGRRRRIRPTSS